MSFEVKWKGSSKSCLFVVQAVDREGRSPDSGKSTQLCLDFGRTREFPRTPLLGGFYTKNTPTIPEYQFTPFVHDWHLKTGTELNRSDNLVPGDAKINLLNTLGNELGHEPQFTTQDRTSFRSSGHNLRILRPEARVSKTNCCALPG